MEVNCFINEKNYLWYLEDEADKLIQSGCNNPKDSYSMILQIINTSICPMINWGIYKCEDNNSTIYYLVKSFWDKEQDKKRLDEKNFNLKLRYGKVSLVPTIKNKQIILNNSYVDKVINKIKCIELKPNSEADNKEGYAILDGIYYKLVLGKMFNNFSIKWREEYPENWSALTLFAIELLKMFKQIDLKQTLKEVREIFNFL